MEIWQRTQDVIKRRAEKAGAHARTSPLSASPTSARRPSSGTRKPASPTTTPSSGRTRAPTSSCAEFGRQRRARIASAPASACRWRPTSPAPRFAGCSTTCPAKREAERGDAVFGNIDTWVDLEPDRRPRRWRPHHRRHQRQPHDADEPRPCDWDKEICRDHGRAARHAAQGHALQRPSMATPRPTARFGGRIPVCGDLGDQQAATGRPGLLRPGEAKNTYGTGCFMLMNTGTEIVPSKNGLLTTLATSSATRRPSTRWKARSRSPARWSSGCATTWA
jgi:glycerol kinase